MCVREPEIEVVSEYADRLVLRERRMARIGNEVSPNYIRERFRKAVVKITWNDELSPMIFRPVRPQPATKQRQIVPFKDSARNHVEEHRIRIVSMPRSRY
jgi:hypothetical protein